MYLPSDKLEELLQCPVTGTELRQRNGQYVGSDESMHTFYPIVNQIPYLVDFANSVIEEPQSKEGATVGGSPIVRIKKSGLRQLGSKVVSTDSSVTEYNVERMLKLLRPLARVLVIGGGTIGKGMDKLYESNDLEIVSFDIYSTADVQFVADAHNIPLKSGSFDAVIIQAVLEHVLVPGRVVEEIWRVLKSDGIVYAETPFIQQVHEGAYDFTRFTESGHRNLFRYFSRIDSGVMSGPAMALLWSIDYFVSGVCRSRCAGKVAKLLFFWLKYFDNLIPPSFKTDGASGVYFLGERQNEAVSISEIISSYQGQQK